jgi:hypothetical protein
LVNRPKEPPINAKKFEHLNKWLEDSNDEEEGRGRGKEGRKEEVH